MSREKDSKSSSDSTHLNVYKISIAGTHLIEEAMKSELTIEYKKCYDFLCISIPSLNLSIYLSMRVRVGAYDTIFCAHVTNCE